MPDVQLLAGDCLDLLRTLPDASVDACVTDPPAGIAFMGRAWDHDKGGRAAWVAWMAEVMTEVHRVLKPGGHAFVWALPRTAHWTATALEDAGFEIRDKVYHLFGSGFPKSLAVDKQLDKMDAADARRLRDLRFTAWMRASGLTTARINELTGSFMGSHYLTEKEQPAVATAEMFDKLRPYLPPVPDWVEQMVAERTIESENYKRRQVTGQETKARSTAGKSALPTVGGVVRYETWDITAPATDLAQAWAGWGTALKPAAEEWILARKPLAGTVAATVATYGTGALNIAACRVGYQGAQDAAQSARPGHEGETSPVHVFGPTHMHAEQNPAGRWPPNVLLQHAPGCVPAGTRQVRSNGAFPQTIKANNPIAYRGDESRPERISMAAPDGTETVAAWICAPGCPVAALDAQSGERPSRPGSHKLSGVGMFSGKQVECESYPGDTGGASRFYPVFPPDPPAPFLYCAKASRRERNAGCAGLPEQAAGVHDDDSYVWPLNGDGSPRGKKVAPRANHHPTVKPQALMRWLCTLITPPGGTILDPFCGSGSTGVAAVTLGYGFIGCEQDAAYLAIAQARIAHAQAQQPAATQPALEMTA